jgi:hypothetical protein
MAIVGGKAPAAPDARAHTQRVVVKFAPSVRIPLSDAAEAAHAAAYRHAWEALRSAYPGVTLRPFFAGLDAGALEELDRRMTAAGGSARLTSYFAIVVPRDTDAGAVARAVAGWTHVEMAYVEGGPVPPPVFPSDDPLSGSQGYLSPAPAGIDALFAWAQADGSGTGFVDLEQGWTLDHEDLPAGIPVIGTGQQIPEWAWHGTAVLGIVAAVDNDKGGVGIAPQTTTRVVSQWFPPVFSTASAIALAVAEMHAGDVLLVETTAPPDPRFGWVPAEVDPLVFDLIKGAGSLGITVLEPAANNQSGSNLDDYTDSSGKFVLNRARADFKDSGAIMVGAGSSEVPHVRLGLSNFGSRVDCYAWGEHIATCGGDIPMNPDVTNPQQAYTLSFGGCSGATAIVAGAAALMQSWATGHQGAPLPPATLRALLSDLSLNTPTKSPNDDRIGVMPDLARVIQHLSVRAPRTWAAVWMILFGVIQDGGGWGFKPGGGGPIPPWGPDVWLGLPLEADKRDVLVGLAVTELARIVNDPTGRRMLERSGAALMRSASDRIAARIEER